MPGGQASTPGSPTESDYDAAREAQRKQQVEDTKNRIQLAAVLNSGGNRKQGLSNLKAAVLLRSASTVLEVQAKVKQDLCH